MENIFDIAIIILFCIFLYKLFYKKPKIKTIKAPTTKEIRKKKRHNRKIKRFKRVFHLPYRGKNELIEFDKKKPYIDSMWDEIEHK